MALGVQIPSNLDSRTRSEVEAEVIADYRASSPRSAALHEAARRVMPGGDTRTVAFHAPYPLVITEGRGCRIQDADGRTYVDLLNNYTSLIHGHAHPAVVAAVSERLPYGTAFPAPNEAQTRLARDHRRPRCFGRHGALLQLRFRGGHERAAGGARVHRPRSDRQDGGRLPRHVRRRGGERAPRSARSGDWSRPRSNRSAGYTRGSGKHDRQCPGHPIERHRRGGASDAGARHRDRGRHRRASDGIGRHVAGGSGVSGSAQGPHPRARCTARYSTRS